ncbi:hypothetical protein E1A90_01710 (plasmid) [Bacillus mycoides]|nr:hypothetical protein E1A90_01710 [Bacillus mycoides]
MHDLLILLILFALILITLVIMSFKFKKVNLGWIFICCITFILGAFAFWLYSGDFKFTNNDEFFRTLAQMCTLVITTTSVIIAVQSSNKTALANKETKIESTIMNLVKLNNDIIKDIDKEIFPKVLKEIEGQLTHFDFYLSRGREFIRAYFAENEKELLNVINSVDLSNYDNRFRMDLEQNRAKYIKAITKRDRRTIHVFWYTINEMCRGYKTTVVELNEGSKQKIFRDSFTMLLDENTDFYKKIKHEYAHTDRVLTSPVQYQEMRIACNTIFNKYYHELGHFFRNTHRIIKVINDRFDYNDKKKSEFIGILRAQLSEEILLTLFYNAVYSNRGIGLARELIGNNFFGNEKDFPYYVNNNDPKANRNYQEPQHFRKSSAILPSMDIEIMATIFSSQQKKEVREYRLKYSNERLLEEFDKIFRINISYSYNQSFK